MKNERNVEQMLGKYLHKDEVVCWEGVTAPFALLEKDAKTKILGLWIGTVVVAAAFLGLYIKNNAGKVSVTTILIVVGIVVVMCLLNVFQRNSLLKQKYWLTDQRAILMTSDGAFYSMELEHLDSYQVLTGKMPHGTLVLGSKLFEEGDKQMRWRGCHPLLDDDHASNTEDIPGLLFLNVENCAEAEKYLKQWAVKA